MVHVPDVRARDRGASATEYALTLAAVAAVVLAVMFVLGGGIKSAFNGYCVGVTGAGCATGQVPGPTTTPTPPVPPRTVPPCAVCRPPRTP